MVKNVNDQNCYSDTCNYTKIVKMQVSKDTKYHPVNSHDSSHSPIKLVITAPSPAPSTGPTTPVGSHTSLRFIDEDTPSRSETQVGNPHP